MGTNRNKAPEDSDAVIIGRNIKELRKLRGISQEELADLVGYTNKSAVSRMEKGEWTPSPEKLEKIAEVLQATPEEIQGDAKNYELTKAKLRQKAYSEFQTLFSLSSKATPEQLQSAIDYLRFLTQNNSDDDNSSN